MSTSIPFPKPEVTLSLTLSPSPTPLEALKPEERGIRLIQLLLSCAKHTSSGNLHRADECLRQILLLASVSGDSMQRLSARFASALAIRLVKRWPGLHKALNYTQLPKQEFDQAKPLFRQAFPYLGFSYAIISHVLIRAMVGERVIHLVDLGSGDENLWIQLLRSLSCLPDGPPHLKVTYLNSNKAILEKLGPRLVKEAEALDMPFQFNPLNVSLRELTLDMLKVRSGEALAFISILNLHTLLAEDDRVDAHFGDNKNINDIKDSKQMCRFLTMIRSVSPKLLLLVEQEADHNLNRLVDRFVEGLHYYSAVFDSIDAKFGAMSSGERLVLEEMIGKEIENIVACEGLERQERHERYGRWLVRFGQGGFKPVRIWYDSIENAKQMVEACGRDRYKIINEKASLMICWHDRPLYAVSAWTC
ncbi:Transcription factor GRAS [Corchorus capsularis]|uniref:Transcription factor GRAS n=1 Tax=Corchorus capsularis TaxID=210143 RepID=A0A1R3JYD6_COCAP|nr:Transcription factor GRAS [Corchorus capsularis]